MIKAFNYVSPSQLSKESMLYLVFKFDGLLRVFELLLLLEKIKQRVEISGAGGERGVVAGRVWNWASNVRSAERVHGQTELRSRSEPQARLDPRKQNRPEKCLRSACCARWEVEIAIPAPTPQVRPACNLSAKQERDRGPQRLAGRPA